VIEYDALARRSFNEPLDVDERESLRVWADALEAAGDPRGRLIAIEHAIREHPERRVELARATNEHLAQHADPMMVGAAAPLLSGSGVLELEWRSGLLYGATLDTRRTLKADLGAHELVLPLLSAPMAKTLRRLTVRVRHTFQVDLVLRELDKTREPRPLEEIAIAPGPRPRRISDAAPRSWDATKYPRTRSLVVDDTAIALPLGGWGRVDPDEVRRAHSPAQRYDRWLLGRALTAADADIRFAALERIAALGPAAFMFVETLLVLLAPGLVPAQDTVVRCLAALGPAARSALPRLAAITGAPHYDTATRKAAGHAIAELA
jgi:hypothetical protein